MDFCWPLVVAIAGGQGLRIGLSQLTRGDPAEAGQRAALVLAGSVVLAAVAEGLQQLAVKGAGAVAPIGAIAVIGVIAGIGLLGAPTGSTRVRGG